jgi:SAM-dependent methyltransferase
MIKRLIGKITNSLLLKRYLEPLILNSLENFYFNKKITGSFLDSSNNNHNLYAGLRSKIKPGWQAMLIPENKNKIPSHAELKTNLVRTKRILKDFKHILSSFNVDLKEKDVLEIGCHNGMKTYCLGLEDCELVTGSDVSFYYEGQTNDVNSYLNQLRQKTIDLFQEKEKNVIKKKVKFLEDDISKTSISANTYDIIASWETLEHIIDIDAAFKNMHRILKPNGITFHQYNPFFSLNGGHSLCTLDFLWGHCRLNENDFLRYIHDFRANEYQLASSFYLNSLNRLTISDLEKASKKNGLEILTLVPFVKKAHLSVYQNIFYEQIRQHYPTVQQIDLISPVIWVIQRKV